MVLVGIVSLEGVVLVGIVSLMGVSGDGWRVWCVGTLHYCPSPVGHIVVAL